jgi:hypothetical protein
MSRRIAFSSFVSARLPYSNFSCLVFPFLIAKLSCERLGNLSALEVQARWGYLVEGTKGAFRRGLGLATQTATAAKAALGVHFGDLSASGSGADAVRLKAGFGRI